MLRHMSVSIEGLLAMSDARMKRMLNSVKDENGNQPTLQEFRKYLNKEWSIGHRLLPVPECDNFDPVLGCLGHPPVEYKPSGGGEHEP